MVFAKSNSLFITYLLLSHTRKLDQNFSLSPSTKISLSTRMMMMMMESDLGHMLMKVALFVLVQALVYLILSKSSSIFSKDTKRSFSFKPARSVSINRILAAISDMPAGGEPSPLPRGPQSPIKENPRPHDHTSQAFLFVVGFGFGFLFGFGFHIYTSIHFSFVLVLIIGGTALAAGFYIVRLVVLMCK